MSWWVTLFLLFFTAYFLHALHGNLRDENPEPMTAPGPNVYLLQSPLFLLAIVLAAGEGFLGRGLISPPHILLGILAGHLTFAVSVWVTHRNSRDAWQHFTHIGPILHFFKESPALLLRFLFISVVEEIIYRGALQPLLIAWTGSPAWSILLVAILFSMVHWHFFRNRAPDSLEFLAFSVLLGVLFHLTGNLALVIMIHTLRNLEIVYLEYLVKLEAYNDEARALQSIEARYLRHASEEA